MNYHFISKVSLMAILFACCFNNIKGQQIAGQVMDQNGKHIPAASMMLKRLRDSGVVKLSVSGDSGKYIFNNVPVGSYFIYVSCSGYASAETDSIRLGSTDSILLPTIVLSGFVRNLKEVVGLYPGI